MIQRALLLFCSIMVMVSGKTALAQTCTASASTLNFGTISGSLTVQTDTVADIAVNCSGGKANSLLRVCLGINEGTGLGSRLENRRMNSGRNTVQYQIYANPARTIVWGLYGAIQEGQQFSIPLDGAGAGSISPSMYGRLFGGQTIAAGVYNSTLIVVGRIPNGNSPCSSNSPGVGFATTFNATVTNSPTCTVNASEIDFGTVASLAGAITATGSLQLTCTAGAAYTVAMNGGSTTGNIANRKMSRNGVGPGIIGYQLYLDSNHKVLWGDGSTGAVLPGTGTGAPQTASVFAQVPAQPSQAVGSFRDTVTVTVSY